MVSVCEIKAIQRYYRPSHWSLNSAYNGHASTRLPSGSLGCGGLVCFTAGPQVDTRENWSEAVKRLKPRLLQRLADGLRMDSCLVFVRTNFDADNLEKFLNSLSAPPAPSPQACQWLLHCRIPHDVMCRQHLEVLARPANSIQGHRI